MSANNPEFLPVPGIRLGTVCAGIKKPDKRDLVVVELTAGTNTAAGGKATEPQPTTRRANEEFAGKPEHGR